MRNRPMPVAGPRSGSDRLDGACPSPGSSSSSRLTGITQIATGLDHTLALKDDGTVWAWGNNDYGQLGDGTQCSSYAPTLVSALTGVKAVAAGAQFSLALKTGGSVWAWGDNDYGQLGVGEPREARGPTVWCAGIRDLLTGVCVGVEVTDPDFTVGVPVVVAVPLQVGAGLAGATVTAVAVGRQHSLALRADGTVAA